MQSRIRTVKPNLFRHEGLFDLERATGLPIRASWIGLFTLCDRAGRFEWKPRQIKLDVLPWDDLDFEDVLNALLKDGFIKKYEVEGKTFGYIPTWEQHQIINNREAQSQIPCPESGCVVDACGTRESRSKDLPVHTTGELNRIELNGTEHASAVSLANPTKAFENRFRFDFKKLLERYPKDQTNNTSTAILANSIKDKDEYDDAGNAIEHYRKYCEREGLDAKHIMNFTGFWEEWRDWLNPNNRALKIKPKNKTPAAAICGVSEVGF